MKIKEEELKLIQEQQKQHGLLHDVAKVNKDIDDYKEVLEAEYGTIEINLEDGSYTKIDVEGNKED